MSKNSTLRRRLHRCLRQWFRTHARTFPWRTTERDPYVVLVAEVMLQQTQAERAQRALPAFLQRFPTLTALAAATAGDVLRAWQGLGYNRRALNLHRCARVVVERFGGVLPASYAQLRSLPGIGDYTARALLAFAFRQDVAVVDVNVRRVLSRVLVPQQRESDLLPMATALEMAEWLLPRGGGRWWNEALMDVGSLYCTRRSPRCHQCPLRRLCASSGKMRATTTPRRPEPSYRGIPRRLWRGRLIAFLRTTSAATVEECACALFGTASAEDCRYIESIAAQLVAEGMLERTSTGKLRLPH